MNESFLALKATRNKVDPPREYQSPAELSYLLQGDRSSEFLFLCLSTLWKRGPVLAADHHTVSDLWPSDQSMITVYVFISQ